MTAAEPTVTADDDAVRVTEWRFPSAGAATGAHRHEFDYVVVPVSGGVFEVIAPDGSRRTMNQVAGEPYRGSAGAEHDVLSLDGPAVFVEVEHKR